MLICCTFASYGALAKSVEHGADDGKVLRSRLTRPDLTFYMDYFLFLSSFVHSLHKKYKFGVHFYQVVS